MTESLAAALERCGATVDRAARPEFDVAANLRVYQELTAANEVLASGAESSVSLLRWRLAKEMQQTIRAAWGRFFARFDVLIVPSHPTTAFLKDEGPRSGRRVAITVDGVAGTTNYWKALSWASLTNVGLLPSTTFPCGTGPRSGLPVGLNAVGPEWSDLVTIDFARLVKVEAGFGGFLRFAAAEVVTPDMRPRAISWTVAASVAAAVIGPRFAQATRGLMPHEFVGTYIAVACLAGVYILVLAANTGLPRPAVSAGGSGGFHGT